jgi:enterochelin esterase-like enzyme
LSQLGAKHPELFSAIVEYSGAFAEWGSAWEMSRQHAKELNDTVAYLMVVGDDDQEFQSNVRFHEFLTTVGIRHEFIVLRGFGHNGGAYADEGTGIRFVSRHFEKTMGGTNGQR